MNGKKETEQDRLVREMRAVAISDVDPRSNVVDAWADRVAALGVIGWRGKDDLAELDFDVPVLVRLRGNPYTWTAMREYVQGEGWLWAMHSGGPLDDRDSYEADDDYDVESWMPLPQPPATEDSA